MPYTRQAARRAGYFGGNQHPVSGLGGWAHSAVRNYRLAKTFLPPLAAATQFAAGLYGMPARPPVRRLRRRRALKRVPRYRRTYRRKAPRRVGRRRGRRYVGAKTRQSRLNTNFQRNDRRSIRVTKRLGSVLIGEGSPLSNNERFHVHLDHWTTAWSRVIEAYEEFRFSQIQFVLEPRSIITGASRVEMAAGELPYLGIREVQPIATPVTNINREQMQQTPGFRYIPVKSKRRHTINVAPKVSQLDTAVQETGNLTFDRLRKAGWMKIETATKALDVAAIEIRRPHFLVGQGNEITFDVYCYATIHFRGNNDELVSPY